MVRVPAADGQRTSSVTSGGQLAVYRQEVRPFTDKQVALLKNFAAQAIITRNGISQMTAHVEAAYKDVVENINFLKRQQWVATNYAVLVEIKSQAQLAAA